MYVVLHEIVSYVVILFLDLATIEFLVKINFSTIPINIVYEREID